MNETAIIVIAAILIFAALFFVAAKNDRARAAEAAVCAPPEEPPLEVVNFWNVPMPKEHKIYVHNLCEFFGMSEAFVYGVIFAESGFNPDAVNERTGCYGYMQLDPILYPFHEYAAPSRNLFAGICLLAELSEKYENPVTVLLCYNWGETDARRLIEDGVTETPYTRKVLAFAENLTANGRLYEEVEE